MANETIMRFQIADYLGIPGDSDTTYALMGAGFNTLDENPAAQLGHQGVYQRQGRVQHCEGLSAPVPL